MNYNDQEINNKANDNSNSNINNSYYKNRCKITKLKFFIYSAVAVLLVILSLQHIPSEWAGFGGSSGFPTLVLLSYWVDSFSALVLLTVAGVSLGLAIAKFVELLSLFIRRPKYIYLLGRGLALFEEKEVEMCEKMALEGYVLVSVSRLGFYKFEIMQPEDYDYAVDYTEDINRRQNNIAFDEYVEIFKSGGWSYVCGSVTFHWFKAPKGTLPIYTDDVSMMRKYEAMYDASKDATLAAILLDGMLSSIMMFFAAPLAFPLFGFFCAMAGIIVWATFLFSCFWTAVLVVMFPSIIIFGVISAVGFICARQTMKNLKNSEL